MVAVSQRGPKTDRMRKLALALPETHEEVTWGEDLIPRRQEGVSGPARSLDWTEIEELITSSYCLTTPKRLAKHVRPRA